MLGVFLLRCIQSGPAIPISPSPTLCPLGGVLLEEAGTSESGSGDQPSWRLAEGGQWPAAGAAPEAWALCVLEDTFSALCPQGICWPCTLTSREDRKTST